MILAALLSLAALAGQGLEVDHVRADAGEVYLRVTEIDPSAAAAEELRLTLDHGSVQEMDVRRVTGDGVLTLLALDQSGSFKAYRPEALELSRAYVESRQEGERVGVVLFGLSAEDLPTSADDAALSGALERAASRPSQPETRLGEFVRQAASRAHGEHPPSAGGIRQVVVFTDGGEESTTWSVDEVAAEASGLDVRVHVVAFYRSSRGELASRLDNLSRLADRTGGTYVQVESGVQAREAMLALAASSKRSLEVRATVCGSAPAARFDNHAVLAADLNPDTTLTTDAVAFEHVGLPLCEGSDGASPLGLPLATDGGKGPSTWACLCPALAILLGILGLIGLSIWSGLNRRERDPTPNPNPTPNPTPTATPTPPPTATPTATPTAGPPSSEPPPPRPQFPEDLPETHLVGAGDGPLAGQRWRFRARILHAGAEPDNELVADLEQVSGHHARFELYRSGDVYVVDLGSTNGTWVQGRRLAAGERALVRPGDRVAISAQVVLELVQPGRTS